MIGGSRAARSHIPATAALHGRPMATPYERFPLTARVFTQPAPTIGMRKRRKADHMALTAIGCPDQAMGEMARLAAGGVHIQFMQLIFAILHIYFQQIPRQYPQLYFQLNLA
jgi:hypothetical protein